MIPKNIDNLKDVGLYTFKTDEKDNIELSFCIEEAGDYKIILTDRDIKAFEKINRINRINKVK